MHGSSVAPTPIGLARPSLAQGARILRFVPQADLANPDPVWSTAVVAFEHAYMIWDQLYGLDEGLNPSPQMVAGDETDADGLTWRLTLRDGLIFHDGAPVRAQDWVVSILLTAKRVPTVQTLIGVTNEVKALDDKRIEFRLKKKFPLLTFALCDAFIMPERIAQTDAFTQISEYTPAAAPIAFCATNGRPARLRRMRGMRDTSRARNRSACGLVARSQTSIALNGRSFPIPPPRRRRCSRKRWTGSGSPLIDLTPKLHKSREVKVEVFDRFGGLMVTAFNHYIPPFDNVKLRRAILSAVNQQDYVTAVVGEQADLGRVGVGVFPLASPYASAAGMEAVTGPRDIAKSKRMIEESGYKGEPIVLMVPSDQPNLVQADQVTNALFKSLGLNVQFTMLD
jgi:peptide/nickel transport system substrate-binding protein